MKYSRVLILLNATGRLRLMQCETGSLDAVWDRPAGLGLHRREAVSNAATVCACVM